MDIVGNMYESQGFSKVWKWYDSCHYVMTYGGKDTLIIASDVTCQGSLRCHVSGHGQREIRGRIPNARQGRWRWAWRGGVRGRVSAGRETPEPPQQRRRRLEKVNRFHLEINQTLASFLHSSIINFRSWQNVSLHSNNGQVIFSQPLWSWTILCLAQFFSRHLGNNKTTNNDDILTFCWLCNGDYRFENWYKQSFLTFITLYADSCLKLHLFGCSPNVPCID